MARAFSEQTTTGNGNVRGTDGSNERASANTDTDTDAEDDAVFGVVSVLYHALQGASAARKYIRDAQSTDQEELADFFQRVRADDISRAKEAKQLLVSLTDEEDDEDDDVASTSKSDDRDEDEDAADDQEA